MSDKEAETVKNLFIREQQMHIRDLVFSPSPDICRGNAAALMAISMVILKDLHGYQEAGRMLKGAAEHLQTVGKSQ